MEKFSNAKVGEGVWSSIHGWGNIIGGAPVSTSRDIAVAFDDGDYIETFYYDGRLSKDDKYPTLFWNEFHILTDEEDKRPFDLVEYLRDNIEPTEFVAGAENVTFSYDYLNNSWNIGVYNFVYVETIYISKKSEEEDYLLNDILNVFAENKVTPQRLKQAYNELGWL